MKLEKPILGCACIVMLAPCRRTTLPAAKHSTPLESRVLLRDPRNQRPTVPVSTSPKLRLLKPRQQEVNGRGTVAAKRGRGDALGAAARHEAVQDATPEPTPSAALGLLLGIYDTVWAAALCTTHHITAPASLRGTNTPHPEPSSLGVDPARKLIPESPR